MDALLASRGLAHPGYPMLGLYMRPKDFLLDAFFFLPGGKGLVERPSLLSSSFV
jgi:hypothetical protein